MNIECVICYENLQSSEIINNTPCGHVFHHKCLANWFERSKTCPECRQNVAESKIGRIYLNYASNDSILEITSALQGEIAGLNHELLIKEIEIIESNSNNSKLTTSLRAKETEIKKLETDLEFAWEHHRIWKNHAQMQTMAYEVSTKEVIRLQEELNELKNEFTTCLNDRNDLQRIVTRLEQELEINSGDRMFSVDALTRQRQLEEDLACSGIEKIALQNRIKELEENMNLAEKTKLTNNCNTDSNEPMEKKLKTSEISVDVVDLTDDGNVDPFVDLTNDYIDIS